MLPDFIRMLADRPGRRGWVLGCWVLLQSSGAVAAPVTWFSDDFETGTLLASDSPAGRWDNAIAKSPNTLSSGVAGAHRGQYGLTASDRNGSSGGTFHASTYATLSSQAPDFFIRTWLRVRSIGTLGSVVAIQALPATVELRLAAPGFSWELAARQGASQAYVSVHGSPVEAERWHLVEISARGLKSLAGEARLWVDGVEQGVLSGRDWSGSDYHLETLQVGEPWSDTGAFTGFIDFDDLRVGDAPMASRLELREPEDAGDSPGCIAVDVSLRTSGTRALAPAPYDVAVSLASTVGGASGFHADAACRTPLPPVLLPAGASERRVYFHAGDTWTQATLNASHPDFLPTALAVEGGGALPDVGALGPWTLGCASAPGVLLAWPLVLLAALRRGRRRALPAQREAQSSDP